MVANFRNPDAQRRLLTAVIAAHPELKLNFKDIAKHYGEDWTKDGIEHFFRPLKKDAVAVRKVVQSGQSAKEFFDNKPWQFRGIKREAEAMRQGKSGAAGTTAAAAGSAPVTPKGGRKRAAAATPSTGRSTATKKARSSAAKPVQTAPVITVDDDDDEDANEFPPIPLDTPTQGPRFTDMGAKHFYANDPQAPALDTTQAETPTEEEDFKPHTPSDAAAFSFSHAPPSSGVGIGSYNYDAYPISQPSFAPSSGFPKSGFMEEWGDDDDEV